LMVLSWATAGDANPNAVQASSAAQRRVNVGVMSFLPIVVP
jgi:hypothetical protein